jgi:hypothetical protein
MTTPPIQAAAVAIHNGTLESKETLHANRPLNV